MNTMLKYIYLNQQWRRNGTHKSMQLKLINIQECSDLNMKKYQHANPNATYYKKQLHDDNY